jgi:hypothetical protein
VTDKIRQFSRFWDTFRGDVCKPGETDPKYNLDLVLIVAVPVTFNDSNQLRRYRKQIITFHTA